MLSTEAQPDGILKEGQPQGIAPTNHHDRLRWNKNEKD